MAVDSAPPVLANPFPEVAPAITHMQRINIVVNGDYTPIHVVCHELIYFDQFIHEKSAGSIIAGDNGDRDLRSLDHVDELRPYLNSSVKLVGVPEDTDPCIHQTVVEEISEPTASVRSAKTEEHVVGA